MAFDHATLFTFIGVRCHCKRLDGSRTFVIEFKLILSFRNWWWGLCHLQKGQISSLKKTTLRLNDMKNEIPLFTISINNGFWNYLLARFQCELLKKKFLLRFFSNNDYCVHPPKRFYGFGQTTLSRKNFKTHRVHSVNVFGPPIDVHSVNFRAK